MVVYCLMLVLALRNICLVVPHHYKQLKMLPSPAFYAFALVAISLRPVYMIGHWTHEPIYFNLDKVQQCAKLCVGIVQDWITFELAVRIHIEKSKHKVTAGEKNRLKTIFKVVWLVLIIALIAFIITVIVSAHQNYYGLAFGENIC